MSPNALCFGNKFPASGAPCFVQVDGEGLTISFESEGGDGSRDAVPFSALTVSAGGLDHDHLVVKWANVQGERTLYLKDPDVIRTFRQAAPDHLNAPFEQAAERVRQVRHRHRVMWAAVGGLILATVLGLWFGSDLLV